MRRKNERKKEKRRDERIRYPISIEKEKRRRRTEGTKEGRYPISMAGNSPRSISFTRIACSTKTCISSKDAREVRSNKNKNP